MSAGLSGRAPAGRPSHHSFFLSSLSVPHSGKHDSKKCCQLPSTSSAKLSSAATSVSDTAAYGKGFRHNFPHLLENTGLGETPQLQMKAGF